MVCPTQHLKVGSLLPAEIKCHSRPREEWIVIFNGGSWDLTFFPRALYLAATLFTVLSASTWPTYSSTYVYRRAEGEKMDSSPAKQGFYWEWWLCHDGFTDAWSSKQQCYKKISKILLPFWRFFSLHVFSAWSQRVGLPSTVIGQMLTKYP